MRIDTKLSSRPWARTAWQAKVRDNFTCQHCGKITGAIQADHVVARVLGGAKYDLSNVQCLCKNCHAQKTRTEHPFFSAEREAYRALLDTLLQEGTP